MAAKNTVEATLAVRYVDGLSPGINQTERIVRQQMGSMVDATSHYAAASVSAFQRTSAAASVMTLAIVASLAMAARALISFVVSKLRAASELTELKLLFEGLAQATGWHADTVEKLKKATDGLISSSEILKNVNRVMQSGVRISDQLYIELTSNIFRLAKASGKDGTQAISAMTDALIKGNARSLHAVGLHLNVKDAISEMAAAAGASTSTIGSAATMQAFYQELIEKTRAAVAKLPEDFISFEDGITRAEKAWQEFFNTIGEGVNRSGVFQEMLRRVIDWLDRLTASKGEIEAIALSTNTVLVNSLRIASTVLEGIGWITSGVEVLFGALKAVINFLAIEITWTAARIGNIFLVLINLLAKLPGAAGRFFSGLADSFRTSIDYFDEATRQFKSGIVTAFDDVGKVQSHLDGMAAGARTLAGDLDRFRGVVVTANAGLKGLADGTDQAAVSQKQLAAATKEFLAMRADLAKASLEGELRVWDAYFRDLHKINANIAASDTQKRDARLLLAKKYSREMVRIQEEEYNKAAARVRDFKELTEGLLADVIRLGMEVSKLPAAPNYGPAAPTNIADDPGYRAIREAELRRIEEFKRIQEALRSSNDRNTPDWAKPLRDMHLELERLNGIGMDPFHQTLAAMKANVVDFAGEAGQAFANFFSDLVSGQENAGKKFLAAFVSMIGQMLVKNGVLLIQTGVAEMALASTLIGKMMGASHAAGARAIAVGAMLAAAGGIMVGAASSMAGANQAGSSATYQQNIARPTSQTVQMIQVGAPGRSQTPGVTAQQPTPVKHEVVVRLAPGLVAQEAAKDIRNNGVLRVAVVGASA